MKRGVMGVGRGAVMGAVVVAWLAGCGTVRPEPFVELHTGLTELRGGSEVAASAVVSGMASRQWGPYVDPAVEAGERFELVEGLRLEQGEQGALAWSGGGELLGAKAERFRAALSLLNTALVDYAAAMMALADPELVDPAAFDAMRRDLNANLKAAAAAVGTSEVRGANGRVFGVDGFALFSTLATEATRAWIEAQRKDRLAGLIEAHQDDIEAAAWLGREAVDVMAAALWAEYNAEVQPLLLKAHGQGASGVAGVQSGLEDVARLNEAHTRRLAALRVLAEGYERLPAAHAALAEDLRASPSARARLAQLADVGRRMRVAYGAVSE